MKKKSYTRKISSPMCDIPLDRVFTFFEAIQALNGASMGDRTLVVNEARPKEDRSGGGGGRRFDGGGGNRDRRY
jgi:hypothetical protein